MNISWTIILSGIYIIIIILILNSISPNSASSMKDLITRIINLDITLLTDFLSKVSKFILSFFWIKNEKDQSEKNIIINVEEKINNSFKNINNLFS
jgi:hypothetical protein